MVNINYELTDQEREVIYHRENHLTFEAIGKLMELSGSRISQIYNKAMWKMGPAHNLDWQTVRFLGLSTRVCNYLLRHGYDTIEDLLEVQSPEQLIKIKGFGKPSLEEVIKAVHEAGYKMKWEEA